MKKLFLFLIVLSLSHGSWAFGYSQGFNDDFDDFDIDPCLVEGSGSPHCEKALNAYMVSLGCYECGVEKDSTMQTAIKYGSGPLAHVLGTFITSYYGYKGTKSWADAYSSGTNGCPQSITDTLPSYLDYLNDRGAPPMLPDQLTALYGECNGSSLGSFAGFGGAFNPYLQNGFTPNFLMGMGLHGAGGFHGGGFGAIGGIGGIGGAQPIIPGMPGGHIGGHIGGFPGGAGACITAPCPVGPGVPGYPGQPGIPGYPYGHIGGGANAAAAGNLTISLGGATGFNAGVPGYNHAYGNGYLNVQGNLGLRGAAGAHAGGYIHPSVYAAQAGAGLNYPHTGYYPHAGGHIDPRAYDLQMRRSMPRGPANYPGGPVGPGPAYPNYPTYPGATPPIMPPMNPGYHQYPYLNGNVGGHFNGAAQVGLDTGFNFQLGNNPNYYGF